MERKFKVGDLVKKKNGMSFGINTFGKPVYQTTIRDIFMRDKGTYCVEFENAFTEDGAIYNTHYFDKHKRYPTPEDLLVLVTKPNATRSIGKKDLYGLIARIGKHYNGYINDDLKHKFYTEWKESLK